MFTKHMVVIENSISYSILYVTHNYQDARKKLVVNANMLGFKHIKQGYYENSNLIMKIRSLVPNFSDGAKGVSLLRPDQIRYLNGIQDPIMPSQWNDLFRTPEISPEHKLIIAILKDAILVKLRYRDRKNLSKKLIELRDDTNRWLESESTSDVFSFLSICEVLDLDPKKIRRVLKEGNFDKHQIRRITANSAITLQKAA